MFEIMYGTIDLSRWILSAEGRQREVYYRLENPEIPIKVIKPEGRGKQGGRKTSKGFSGSGASART